MNRKRRTTRGRRGFSLVETSAAVMIGGMCLAATTSTVYLVTTGGDRTIARSDANNHLALTLQRLHDEIGMATSITELTSRSVTLSCPDITGDAMADTIRYSWSGTAGYPLVRTLNGTSLNVLESCNNFALSALLENPVEEMTTPTTDVIVMAYHDGYPLAYTARSVNISTTTWYAQTFTPSYTDAVSYTVSSVFLYLRRSTGGTPSGEFKVSLQRVASGTVNPDGTVLREIVVRATDLPTAWGWVEFKFGNVTLNNNESAAVVCRGTAAYTGEVAYNDTLSVDWNDGQQRMRYTLNSGTNWYPTLFQQTKDLRFYAYGFFTLSGSTSTGKYESGTIGSVHVHLERPYNGETIMTDTAVNLLSRPLLSGMSVDDMPLR